MCVCKIVENFVYISVFPVKKEEEEENASIFYVFPHAEYKSKVFLLSLYKIIYFFRIHWTKSGLSYALILAFILRGKNNTSK